MGDFGTPFGPRPGSAVNAFFTDELDVVPQDVQDRVLATYVERGNNELVYGPPFAKGYNFPEWPHTNWMNDVNGYVNWAHGVRSKYNLHMTFVPLPDIAPYWLGDGWDIESLRWNFGPVWTALNVAGVVDEIMLAWEPENVSSGRFGEVLKLVREFFPTQRIMYHGPPGHGAPGLSEEPEDFCWQHLKQWLGGFDRQARPPDSGPGDEGRTAFEQFVYDNNDIARRFNHGYAGWPTIGAFGLQMIQRIREMYAVNKYHNVVSEAVCQQWRQAALATEGVTSVGD